MLPGIAGSIGAYEAVGKSFTLIGTDSDTSTGSTYSFSFGTADADQTYAIGVCATDCVSITGVTLGGSAMTEVEQINQSNDPPVAAIYRRTVTAGTTLSIEVSTSDTARGCCVALYGMVGLTSATPVATDSAASAGASSVTGSLSTQSGDFVVAVACTNTSESSFSWSGGVTEDIDEQFGSGSDGAGSVASGTATASTTSPRAAMSPSEDVAFVAAAWR